MMMMFVVLLVVACGSSFFLLAGGGTGLWLWLNKSKDEDKDETTYSSYSITDETTTTKDYSKFRLKLSTSDKYVTITDTTPADASKVYAKDNDERATWMLIPYDIQNKIYLIKWTGEGTTPLYLNRWGNTESNDTVHLHTNPDDISSRWLIEFSNNNDTNLIKLKRPPSNYPNQSSTKYLSMGADGSGLVMTETGTEFVFKW